MIDVFLNGRYMGMSQKPEKLIEEIKSLKRKGQISNQVNIAYLEHLNMVDILTDGGRTRRPLIAVENGKPKLTKEHLESLKKNEIKWTDLVNQGVIEYLDAEEEENAYIALVPQHLTDEHTHLELDPVVIFGLATSFIPFLEFDRGDRVNFGSKMVGQSIGMFSLNFPRRVDTKSNVLVYPQTPIVETHINEVLGYGSHPGGQNTVVAFMPYKGFNMDDAIVVNKSSIERGMFWSYLFRTYEAEEKRYMGGQEDIIGIPEQGVRGYGGEDAYKHLPEDGVASPETKLESEQTLIGKTSPLRFLGTADQFITGLENMRETSVRLRHGEEGIIDRVFITESFDGNKLIKVVVRDMKIPEIGDKFASRHGQKGVVGLLVPCEDMPFTENGMTPDIIFNPHGIPSRITIGKLFEMLAGKVASLSGKKLSNPPFHPIPEYDLKIALEKFGYQGDGKENMFNGESGDKFEDQIFIGNIFYQKLDHLVSNKIHARSRGPVTLLTKQPTEGKSKRGGLRLGEMEKDCLIAHGASLLLKERFDSDKTVMPICKNCGLFAVDDKINNKKYCPVCGESKIDEISMAYAFKLLLDELKSILIYPKIIVSEDYMVDRLIFSVLTPEIIKKMAAAKISKTDLYDQEGYPIEGGLMDPRLGVIDPGLRCRTCGGSVGDCKGHFGYLELTKPVIHVHYAKIIYSILKFTCRNCGKILSEKNDIEKFKKSKRLLKTPKSFIKHKCPHCGEKRKKITFLKPTTFIEAGEVLTPAEIRERLQKISHEDLIYFGIENTAPEYFVMSLLPIPPVTVRPSITLETGERSEDDLTHKLVDIVRINKRLRENIDLGAPDFIIQDLWELLQYHIATYINNEITGVPPARHRSGRILKTLTQRLKAKDGRFRHNLIGKRVNFSSRTVISPDPMLDINEVGIPLIVAKELTLPIVVDDKNLKEVQDLVARYPSWPTINYVIRLDGMKKKVSELNKDEIMKEIEPGYVVEKQLEDGDWVLFNRQPSLHRMSMMGHRVRVMPGKTFRLNPTLCPPYNADFDGDEMNIHVPQTKEAQVETSLLTDATGQMRSPRFSGPIIGCDKDYISGCYLLTSIKRTFSREETVDLIRACDLDIKIPNKKTFSGQEIFSLFLPEDFGIEYKGKTTNVIIKNGKLIEGVIDERGVGAFGGKALDAIDKKYGHIYARKFLSNISKLSLELLIRHGFSISNNDYISDQKILNKADRHFEKTKKEIYSLMKNFEKKKIKTIIGRTPEESLEVLVKRKLADLLNDITEMLKKKIPDTNTIIMAKSGARGSIVNYIQTSICIGQETSKGERINMGYYKRTFPHFKKGENSIESKGFVQHGYKKGLTPFEFFFDAINSREGLMDKSLKTRHSGYLERRLVGALKDLKIEYDGTVRDNEKKIIQFIPGEDGLDPSKIQKGGIDVDKISRDLFGK